MKITVNRHETVDNIQYTVSGIGSTEWEAMASHEITYESTMQVKNLTTGDAYKLQHTTTTWDYIRIMIPLADLYVRQHFIYYDNKGNEAEANKLFQFIAPGKRRTLCLEEETYHLDFHANFISSISLPDRQVAVFMETLGANVREVDQYEMLYSKTMAGKEHILLLLLLFHDRMRVAMRRLSEGDGTYTDYSKVPFDKWKHRAKWRPEDDDGFE